MELLLQQILAGLATGAIYATMALAVVMIYQAIDHLNFAQGEMAMFSTFIAWQLIQWDQPYWVAFVGAVVLSFVGGVLIERVLFRPLHNAPVLSQIVAFIALFSILNSLAGFIWDFNIKTFPTPFGNKPLFGGAPDRRASGRHDRRDRGDARPAVSVLSRHEARSGDARRRREPAIGAARRHQGRLDDGARLGHGGRRSARSPAC